MNEGRKKEGEAGCGSTPEEYKHESSTSSSSYFDHSDYDLDDLDAHRHACHVRGVLNFTHCRTIERHDLEKSGKIGPRRILSPSLSLSLSLSLSPDNFRACSPRDQYTEIDHPVHMYICTYAILKKIVWDRWSLVGKRQRFRRRFGH